MEPKIQIPAFDCARCGYHWYLRKPQRPRVCPRCKSPYWNFSSEYKKELDNDILEAKKIEEVLIKKMKELQQGPLHWEEIIGIGLERMFKTSEFPIKNIKEVLDEGFSVYDWFLKVSKITQKLTDDVVKKHMKHKSKQLTMGDSSSTEVEKIKKLLGWEEILENLTEEEVKILAFLWFADYLASGVRYPEAEYLIHKRAWLLLEGHTKRKKEEMLQFVKQMIDRIDEKNVGATSWREIIRFP